MEKQQLLFALKFTDGCRFTGYGESPSSSQMPALWKVAFPGGILAKCPHGLIMQVGIPDPDRPEKTKEKEWKLPKTESSDKLYFSALPTESSLKELAHIALI